MKISFQSLYKDVELDFAKLCSNSALLNYSQVIAFELSSP